MADSAQELLVRDFRGEICEGMLDAFWLDNIEMQWCVIRAVDKVYINGAFVAATVRQFADHATYEKIRLCGTGGDIAEESGRARHEH